MFDDKLDWCDRFDYVMKKLNSHMYCLRKMNAFRVSNEIIVTFYLSAICGVWSYCLTGWVGTL